MRFRHGALLALGLAFFMACGGATKKGAAPTSTTGGNANPDSAAPDGVGSSPRSQIQRLMTSIIRDRKAMGIAEEPAHITAPQPTKNPCAGGGTAPKASTCGDVCKLKDSICGNKDRICDIADNQLPNDDWAQKQCTSAKDSCTRATKRCDSCES